MPNYGEETGRGGASMALWHELLIKLLRKFLSRQSVPTGFQKPGAGLNGTVSATLVQVCVCTGMPFSIIQKGTGRYINPKNGITWIKQFYACQFEFLRKILFVNYTLICVCKLNLIICFKLYQKKICFEYYTLNLLLL